MSIQKKTSSMKSMWYVWIFPVIAIAICGWLFFSYLKQRGPTIKIKFEDGSSIQPEKTKIRYRGVTVGSVNKVYLSDDTKEVIAEVALEKDAESLAVAGSKFWVVMPKVNFQGISGLETLFEGTYIAVQPGNPDGKEELEFKGKLSSENSESVEDTVAYYLETDSADSFRVGDAVMFRGLTIGNVNKVTLGKDTQVVNVQINIQDKYYKLVRTNTVFWKKVAIQANLGLFSSKVRIDSLESLLRGGIDLSTPNPVGPAAKGHTHFPLQSNPPKDWEKWNPKIEL